MAYKTVLDDFKKCISRVKPDKIPAFACSEEFDVRMSGNLYCDYNSDSKIMAQTQIDAVKRFDYDWAWLQVDDCIEFEVLGVGVKGKGNILPATCDYRPANWDTLSSLKLPKFKKDGRMPVLLDAIKRVKDALGESVVVVGRIPAPFSAVTLLYGMSESLIMLYDDPELFKATEKFCEELVCGFAIAQIEAGADALWVGDCNASGHLISLDFYKEFAFSGAKAAADAIRDAGGYSIYHASEHDPEYIKNMILTGVDVVSAGPGIEISKAKAVCDLLDKGCICGNVDPIGTLLYGTRAQVRAETKRILDAGARSPGYIANSGEMIPRDVPEENIRAMIETIKEYKI